MKRVFGFGTPSTLSEFRLVRSGPWFFGLLLMLAVCGWSGVAWGTIAKMKLFRCPVDGQTFSASMMVFLHMRPKSYFPNQTLSSGARAPYTCPKCHYAGWSYHFDVCHERHKGKAAHLQCRKWEKTSSPPSQKRKHYILKGGYRARVQSLLKKYQTLGRPYWLKLLMVAELLRRDGLNDEKRAFLVLRAGRAAYGAMEKRLFLEAAALFVKLSQGKHSTAKRCRFTYLAGELYRRVGQYKKSTLFFKRALTLAQDTKLKRWLQEQSAKARQSAKVAGSQACRSVEAARQRRQALVTKRLFSLARSRCLAAQQAFRKELLRRAKIVSAQELLKGKERFSLRTFLAGIKIALADTSPKVRGFGLDLIERLGPLAAPLVPAIQRFVKERCNKTTFFSLFRAVYHMGKASAIRLLPSIVKAHKKFPYDDSNPFSGLDDIVKEAGKAAIPALWKLAKHKHYQLDYFIVELLSDVPKTRSSMALLLKFLGKKYDENTRKKALDTLRWYWPKHRQVPKLLWQTYQKSKLPDLRSAAVSSLALLKPLPRRPLSFWLKLLGSKRIDHEAKKTLYSALCRVRGTKADTIAGAMRALADAPYQSDKWCAARTLLRYNPNHKAARGVLETLLLKKGFLAVSGLLGTLKGARKSGFLRHLLIRKYLHEPAPPRLCKQTLDMFCRKPLLPSLGPLRPHAAKLLQGLEKHLIGNDGIMRRKVLRLLLAWGYYHPRWTSLVVKGWKQWRGENQALAAGYLLRTKHRQRARLVLRGLLGAPTTAGLVAAGFLLRVSAARKRALAYFRKCLSPTHFQLLPDALMILAETGWRGASLFPQVLRLLHHPNSLVRRAAMLSAGSMRCCAKKLVPVLVKELLLGKDIVWVARALAAMGPKAKKAIPALLWALQRKGDYDHKQLAFLQAITKVAPGLNPRVRRVFRGLRDHFWPQTRRFVRRALSRRK